MSTNLYRGQVDRLTSELAQLEAKAAGERERAAKERADGLRISQSITKTTSASTAQSRLRDVQRREERAAKHDRQAAQYATQSASKRRGLSDAQQRLERAEAAERKKVADEADRRRRDDQRRLNDMERARRELAGPVAPAVGLEASSHEDGRAKVMETNGGDPSGGEESNNKGVRVPGRPVLRLEAETTVDAALDVSKAVALGALSSVPVLGPILREVVGVAWGDNRAARLERFATELGRNVEVLEDRLDRNFVKHDEFEALAEETLERVVLRRNEQKIATFAAAVAHSATVERPDQRTRERFLDFLDELRPIHVQMLGQLDLGREGWVRPPDVITVGQAVNSKLAHALGGLAWDSIDLKELERRGLIYSLDDTATRLNVAEDPRRLLAPTAHEFLNFISTEIGANPHES